MRETTRTFNDDLHLHGLTHLFLVAGVSSLFSMKHIQHLISSASSSCDCDGSCIVIIVGLDNPKMSPITADHKS
jgi:hypothetical protein